MPHAPMYNAAESAKQMLQGIWARVIMQYRNLSVSNITFSVYRVSQIDYISGTFTARLAEKRSDKEYMYIYIYIYIHNDNNNSNNDNDGDNI